MKLKLMIYIFDALYKLSILVTTPSPYFIFFFEKTIMIQHSLEKRRNLQNISFDSESNSIIWYQVDIFLPSLKRVPSIIIMYIFFLNVYIIFFVGLNLLKNWGVFINLKKYFGFLSITLWIVSCLELTELNAFIILVAHRGS